MFASTIGVSSMQTRIELQNGKYTLIHDDGANLRALRYQDPWREMPGDGFVLALAQEIESLREQVKLLEAGPDAHLTEISSLSNKAFEQFYSRVTVTPVGCINDLDAGIFAAFCAMRPDLELVIPPSYSEDACDAFYSKVIIQKTGAVECLSDGLRAVVASTPLLQRWFSYANPVLRLESISSSVPKEEKTIDIQTKQFVKKSQSNPSM